ncbi:MAG: hypothetical protein ACLUPF_10835 [Dorea sp.]
MAKNTENVTEVQMSPEETKANVRMYEDDILGGLNGCSCLQDRYGRGRNRSRSSDTRRLSWSSESVRCQRMNTSKIKKRNTNYKKNKANGLRIAESIDSADYRSELIYEATIEEDRTKIWDRTDAWEKCNVVNGIGLDRCRSESRRERCNSGKAG